METPAGRGYSCRVKEKNRYRDDSALEEWDELEGTFYGLLVIALPLGIIALAAWLLYRLLA